MKKNSKIKDISNMKKICYFYGAFYFLALVLFSVKPEIGNTAFSVGISFVHTGVSVYIMLRFKEALNEVLHSVKMNSVINILVLFLVAGYGLNILALKNPEGIVYYQGLLGIGGIVLYIIYGIFLRNLDAPLEKLKRVKSIDLYSTCILIAVAMAFTLVGIAFFIILMGASYFILGNIFKEMNDLTLENE